MVMLAAITADFRQPAILPDAGANWELLGRGDGDGMVGCRRRRAGWVPSHGDPGFEAEGHKPPRLIRMDGGPLRNAYETPFSPRTGSGQEVMAACRWTVKSISSTPITPGTEDL